jgi:PTH1 family peptidyl-tRNA hydrolase
VVDDFIGSLESVERTEVGGADIAVGRDAGGKRIAAAKPLTYVNRSGEALAAILKKYNLSPSKCLVIVDDFNLPLGRLRFRRNGSDGGHNGLKSIIGYIGIDFPRLRVGIGPRPQKGSVIDFVLGTFSKEESEQLHPIFPSIREAIHLYIGQGIEAVMNRYNS